MNARLLKRRIFQCSAAGLADSTQRSIWTRLSLPIRMNSTENSVAFGAPGIEPRWTSSAKEGVGTAYHTSCRLWFTLSHGIVNEIYVVNPVQSRHEVWSLRHPLRHMSRGKILRIILAAEATIAWSMDGWASTSQTDTAHESGLNLWFADFPTAERPGGSMITFTIFWKRDQRWEG